MAGDDDDVVVIVDDDVIIIDHDAQASKVRRRQSRSRVPRSNKIDLTATIICLDDDDEEEGSLRFHEEAVAQMKKRDDDDDREALRFHDEAVQKLGQMGNTENTEEDMETRQKERIAEIINARKREEMDMQSKDRIRKSIMKEFQELERRCLDMASLLKGLGVLAPESHPTPDEVRLAYKKALLRFHPDRAASGSNIQQQVEAEEKFKVISRAKERFSPSW